MSSKYIKNKHRQRIYLIEEDEDGKLRRRRAHNAPSLKQFVREAISSGRSTTLTAKAKKWAAGKHMQL